MEVSQSWTPETEEDLEEILASLETDQTHKQLEIDRITMDRIDPMWAGAFGDPKQFPYERYARYR